MAEVFDVGVVGARGHTGAELTRIIGAHPSLRLTLAGSRELAGKPVPGIDGAHFQNVAPDDLPSRDLDAVILALPDGVGEPWADSVAPQTVIVDISADHRLDETWVYGLPELWRDKIAGARRIANPGCYATALQLVISPFLERLDGVPAVFGVSGYSGAGTTPSSRNDPANLADNLIPYRLVGHNHEREATVHLGRPVRFMPHVHPAFRGLLVTTHLPMATPIDAHEAFDGLSDRYAGEPLISVVEDVPTLRDGAGLAGVVMGGVAVSEDGLNLTVVAAEDNLLKGAAVQAVQNLNLALGLDEFAGLL